MPLIDKKPKLTQSAVMHLITMAHLGEAQGVIEKFKLKRLTPHLFQGEGIFLLLTGEGPFEAATWTSLILGKYEISKVINLGIAGSLVPDIKVGEIHPVRTHYLVQDMKPAFKTFQGIEKGLDCITSFERILDTEKAQKLKGLGHLVDREAWGVAFACKNAGVPFLSYKIISDMAGTLGACELVREEAEVLSKKIALFMAELLETNSVEKEKEISLSGFHFTFTMNHRLQSLLTKLAIKHELNPETLLDKLPVARFQSLEVLPKERARLFIEFLEGELDPFKRELQLQKNHWLKDIKGIDVITDPQWEDTKVTIRFQVEHDEDLAQKIETLKKLSLTPFKNLMEGKIHVE